MSWLFWTTVAVGIGFLLTGSIFEAVLFAIGAYVFTYLAMVLHELAHFLAAYVVGVHVPAISFGGGLRAKVFKYRDRFVILSPTPSEGLTIVAQSTAEHFRKKAALILAAGPLVNVVSTLAGMSVLIAFENNLAEYVRGATFQWTVINLFFAITNLLSFSHKTAFGEQQSDGAQILALLRMTDEEIDKALRQRNLVLALLYYDFGDMARSHSIVEQELEHGDDSVLTQTLATATLVETDQLGRGEALGREFLRNEALGVMEKALLQNNLAFTLFVTGDDHNLNEADELSAMAMETLPMIMTVKSTRGSVLIAKGRYEEGVALLTDKRLRLESRSNQAAAKAMLAVGFAHLGKKGRAVRSLNAARSLDPSNRHLAYAEAAIAAHSTDGAVRESGM